MNHSKRAYIRKLFLSRFFFIGGLFILVLFSSALGREVLRHYQLDKDIASLESQVSSLEKKERELNGMAGYYESEAYWEREARIKMNLKEKGESVLVIPGIDQKIGEDGEKSKTGSMDNDFSENFNRWVEYFKYGDK